MPIRRAFRNMPRNTAELDRLFRNVDLDRGSLSLDQIQDIASDRLLGRDAAGVGSPETLTVSGGLEFTGSGGIQRSALTGDVTAAAGSNTTTIAENAVTYAKVQNVSATDRILGRSSGGAGDIEEITCTAAGRALLDDATAADQRTTLGLGTAATVNTGSSGATIPLLNATATVSAAWTFSAQAVFSGVGESILMESTLPLMRWVETDGSLNNKRWRMLASGETFFFQVASDDEASSAVIWSVDRTGTTLDRMSMSTVLRAANLGADPASGSNGDIYYNTATNKFRGYAGGAWTDLH